MAAGCSSGSDAAPAATPPPAALDPLTIPKYVTPLVIPPVMNTTGTDDDYDISLRQFKQQILPAGFPATTVWSYGPTADPIPDVAPAANSQFNYPAYTIETMANPLNLDPPITVKWRNELVAINPADGFPYALDSGLRSYLPHLFDVDQTLHWANPPATGCKDGSDRTDCATLNPAPYLGPVPMSLHLHGAHVDAHSDGYPEQWFLPAADDIPTGYATEGSIIDDATGLKVLGSKPGMVDFSYRNDQPATTLWFHDHSLGMTRLNVYAGPAGFWLVRGGPYGDAFVGDSDVTGPQGYLPSPAPVAGQGVVELNTPGDPIRNAIREIPIVIQDRSFLDDGSLVYPDSRIDFDGYTGPYIPDSDIAPAWNPEAFFDTMVVNGTTWPTLEVAPALYRFRLLNGSDSRFLNLALFEADGDVLGTELPFYQIASDQGFLTEVVEVETGFTTTHQGGPAIATPDPQQALLMGLAERADVLVDFRGLANGTHVRMINTAADAPFGGFDSLDPDADPPALVATTGQVMEFVVNDAMNGASPTDSTATNPMDLVLPSEKTLAPPLVPDNTRQVSLNEEESGQVCITISATEQIEVVFVLPAPVDQASIHAVCAVYGAVPQAPASALLGTVDLTGLEPEGVPLLWTDTSAGTPIDVTLNNTNIVRINVTENPTVNTVEDWEIYNFTEDAHPIHIHLVRFEVLWRQLIDGSPGPNGDQQPWETGFKDTVIAYPGEITTVRARFDLTGLYVWHCHILSHEDNEMMRPFVVSAP
jgi:FtsP/CotA-like multicopper oxidase with cupredoxin domain